MEGLIPFLVHTLKKKKSLKSYRSLSDTSNRSYHHLVGGDSVDGSSHRRTKSEFQPYMVDLSEKRSYLDYLTSHATNFNKSISTLAPSNANVSRQTSSSIYQVSRGSSSATVRR